jgi:serine/threonine protein kinase
MLHRDLKSANVLLNRQHTRAKICDFGLSRVARPARQHVIYAPFTGVKHLIQPAVAIESINGEPPPPSLASMIDVSIVDIEGKKTKMAGTMRWIAPEVFRGDQHYGKEVDVYSFGVVMWELATRKMPWQDVLGYSVDDTLKMFEGLMDALQKNVRPAIPPAVRKDHGEFVALMECCWAGDPTVRPTFSAAVHHLQAILRT